jgi:cytosine/adenosine deaminase-related metal-dependent hydrolase
MAAASLTRRAQILTLGALAAVTVAFARPALAVDGMAVVGATVFDGTASAPLADAVIVVAEGKVRSIGPRSMVALPKGVPYVDGRGLFVVPGQVRESKVAEAVSKKVAGGAPFARALEEALRDASPRPSEATIEPGRPADLVLLEKDPRTSVDNLRSIRRVFVAGREASR